MKIELFGSHVTRDSFDISSDAGELGVHSDDFELHDTVNVSCSYSRNGDVIRFDGSVTASVCMQCSRCLDEFDREYTGDFSFVARQLRKGESVAEFPEYDNDDDETRLIYVGHEENAIDITEFVRDALILSIPLKHLCSESCRGLCSVCGANLNEETCSCSSTHTDGRWRELGKLLGREQ